MCTPARWRSVSQLGSPPGRGGSRCGTIGRRRGYIFHELDEDSVSITVDRPSRLISDPSSDVTIEEAKVRPSLFSRAYRSLATEGGIIVLIAFAIYLTVAILLDFKYEILPLDAVSRMANGYYVIWSGDPHLAAVGFVSHPEEELARAGAFRVYADPADLLNHIDEVAARS